MAEGWRLEGWLSVARLESAHYRLKIRKAKPGGEGREDRVRGLGGPFGRKAGARERSKNATGNTISCVNGAVEPAAVLH